MLWPKRASPGAVSQADCALNHRLGLQSGPMRTIKTLKTLKTLKTRKISPLPRLAFFIAAAAAAALLASSLYAATPEEQAVLAPIQAMFDGMAKRDAAAIKEPTLPGSTMVLMRDGKPSQMTFEAFADRVGKPGTTH